MAEPYDAGRTRTRGSRGGATRPSVLAGLGMMAGGSLGRLAVGFLGSVVLVGALTPRRWPDEDPRSRRGAEALGETSIMLEIPDDQAAASLSVLDESGRELATLTRWRDGTIGIAARRGDGTGLWCGIKGSAEQFANLIGTTRSTYILAGPDGTAKTSSVNQVERPRAAEDLPRGRRAERHGPTDAAGVVSADPEEP